MRFFRARRPWAGALFVVMFAVASLWSGAARAFCREVTGTPPVNYDPAVAGCFRGAADAGRPALPLYWLNQCVSYSLQKNASAMVPLRDAQRVARQAFDTWTNASCGQAGGPSIAEYEYRPPVDCDNAPSNEHNNPIIFRDDQWPYDSVNALGFTTLTVDLETGEILGAAIEINSSTKAIVASPDASVPNGAYDLASILTHEAGHFLGLAHSEHTDAVMYASYHAGQSVLTPDDISGVCSIYPPDMTRSTAAGVVGSTSCNATPPLGFLTSCGSRDAGAFITASGALARGDGGDAPCSTSDCAIGRVGRPTRDPPGVGLAMCACAAAAVLVRSRRLERRGDRTRRSAWLAPIAVAGLAFGARDANAAVSVTLLFDDLVQRASGVAVVTPFEQRAVWEDGRIATYTRVRVDRRVTGSVPVELWIRTLGGAVGTIGQIVEGQPTFEVGAPSLVFVHPPVQPGSAPGSSGAWSVVEAAQGQFPLVSLQKGGPERLSLAKSIGALLPPARAVAGARFARDVLVDHAIDDAASEVASAWTRLHAP